MSDINKGAIKLTIAKLIELSINTDKETTLAILRNHGNATIRVDLNGNVTVEGTGKIVTFRGDPALKSAGFKIRFMKITFTNRDEMNLGYNASISGPYGVSAYVTGVVDLENLITSCSGLLCKAARSVKARDEHLQKIMGG